MQLREKHGEVKRTALEARADDEVLLTSSQTGARYGNVTTMSLWRWVNDEKMAFPTPEKINGRNYWRLGDLRHWDANRASAIPSSLTVK